MKSIPNFRDIRIALFALIVSMLIPIEQIYAQSGEEEPSFITFQYMKVRPGMEEKYLAAEKVWKKIHQQRVANGDLVYWGLSKVISPFGTDNEYDYLTVNVYQGRSKLAAHYEGGNFPDLSKIITAEEQKAIDITGQTRDLVKEEVYLSRHEIQAEGIAKVTVIDYFELQEGATLDQHLEMEKATWLPIHQARIDDGNMMGWMILDLLLPLGTDKEYHSVAVEFYKDMEQYLEPWFDEYLAKVHPGMDVDKMLEEMYATWDLVKGDVHLEIDSTE